jgi:ankyrin repeat protein
MIILNLPQIIMFMHKYFRYLIILILTTIPLYVQSQEELPYNDTTYFIPFDDDFNLIMAVSNGHINNVRNLLIRGADINAVTIDNISALMYASENGDFEMVRLLLDEGADPNLKPFNGVTALISTAKLNYQKIGEYLINNNARINEKDAEGITALHYAVAFNYPEMVEMLLFYNADPEIPDDNGTTPIVTAAYNNSLASLKLLIENGVDINSKDRQGFTPLMVAIAENNTEITEFLMENNADINSTNKGGMSALAFAVKEGDYGLVETLIDKGANINQAISKSRNILELAKENQEDDIEELLISEGARPNFFPDYHKIGIGPGLQFNGDDFMTSVNFSLIDTKYNSAIKAGFVFRPTAVRILTKPENDTLFQYWERRYYIYTGLEKKFAIISNGEDNHSGPFVSAMAAYTFGGYRGSNSKPDAKIIPSAQLGWYIMNNWITVKLNYEYLDFGISNLSPHRFNLNLNFNIELANKKLLEKKIDWLQNE